MGAIGKVDRTDIVLHYKLGGKLLGEHFFNRKKRYTIDHCAICDSDKKSHICLLVSQILYMMHEYGTIQIFTITLQFTYLLTNRS